MGRPDLIWTHKDLPWNLSTGGSMAFGMAAASTSNFARSVDIYFNTASLNNSSSLLIAATAVHEVIHAYASYYVKTKYITTYPNEEGYLHSEEMPNSWIYQTFNALRLQDDIAVHGDTRDHIAMMEDLFGVMVNILDGWDKRTHGGNGKYSFNDYIKASMIGLERAGQDFGVIKPENIAAVEATFAKLLKKYNITPAELSAFIIQHTNGNSKISCAK